MDKNAKYSMDFTSNPRYAKIHSGSLKVESSILNDLLTGRHKEPYRNCIFNLKKVQNIQTIPPQGIRQVIPGIKPESGSMK